MTADTFICGSCHLVFHDINLFVQHKTEATCNAVAEMSNGFHLSSNNAAYLNATYFVIQDVNQAGNIAICPEIAVDSDNLPTKDASEDRDASEQCSEQVLEVVPVPDNRSDGVTSIRLVLQSTGTDGNSGTTVPATKSGRKRGRPRKGEEKNRDFLIQNVIDAKETNLPLKDANGNFQCASCLKSFARERHFRTHRCLAAVGYVDITKRDVLNETDDAEIDTPDTLGCQSIGVVSSPAAKKRRRSSSIKRPIKNREIDSPSVVDSSATQNSRVDMSTDLVDLDLKGNDLLPVFQDENEWIAFDRSLQFDLGPLVDHMFKMHSIDQEVDGRSRSRRRSAMDVFSCNSCRKVFMSLSHVRLHCLVHTNLRPFKCFKCEYDTNTRGNLYTHMRSHTGMVFRCSSCDFSTTNRGHLIDHEQTHSRVRQKCEICRHDYNTTKSLMNHVRKYHRSDEGATYLKQFQRSQRNVVLLHQCKVCNRKFKRRSDVDAHLLTHDVSITSTGYDDSFACKICNYVTTCRTSLIDHTKRHLVVYFCAVCSSKFPSSICLRTHLKEKHETSDGMSEEDFFRQSLGKSLYLPSFPAPNVDFGGTASANHVASEQNSAVCSADADSAVDGFTVSSPRVSFVEEDLLDDSVDVFQKLGFVQMERTTYDDLRNRFGKCECEHCGQFFAEDSELQQHLPVHAVERSYVCDRCSFRATSKDALRSHVRNSHLDSVFLCHLCSWKGKSRTALRLHNSKKHKLQPEYLCAKCGIVCNSLKRLRVHLRLSHPALGRAQVRDLVLSFRRSQNRRVRQVHECPHCGKIFLTALTLQRHVWIHDGLKPFKCSACEYCCRSRSNLSAHMTRHSAEIPFRCPHCGKPYKSRTALRWHIRNHKSGKVFACDRCAYTAIQPSHLKRHLETHDVVKRYRCKLCAYSANTESYLKVHYTRKHEGEVALTEAELSSERSDERSTICCFSCDFRFGNVSDLRRHLKVKHQMELVSKDDVETSVTSIEEPRPDLDSPQVSVVSQSVEPVRAVTASECIAFAGLQAEESDEVIGGQDFVQKDINTTTNDGTDNSGTFREEVVLVDPNGVQLFLNARGQFVYVEPDSNGSTTHLETPYVDSTATIYESAQTTENDTSIDPSIDPSIEAGATFLAAVPVAGFAVDTSAIVDTECAFSAQETVVMATT